MEHRCARSIGAINWMENIKKESGAFTSSASTVWQAIVCVNRTSSFFEERELSVMVEFLLHTKTSPTLLSYAAAALKKGKMPAIVCSLV